MYVVIQIEIRAESKWEDDEYSTRYGGDMILAEPEVEVECAYPVTEIFHSYEEAQAALLEKKQGYGHFVIVCIECEA